MSDEKYSDEDQRQEQDSLITVLAVLAIACGGILGGMWLIDRGFLFLMFGIPLLLGGFGALFLNNRF
jgi:hypothetical protein